MNFLWIEDNEKISNLKKRFFDDTKDFDEKLHNLIIPKSFDEALEEIDNAYKKYDFIIIDINLENFEIGKKGKIIQREFSSELSENGFMKEAGFHLYLKLIPQGFRQDRIIFLTGNTKENQISALLWQFEQAIESNDEEVADIIIEKLRKSVNDEEYNKITDLINKQGFNDVKIFWKDLADKYETSPNADNTYDNFKNRFTQARIPLPFSIHKDNKNDFHTWLKGRTQANDLNSYILLRRGIIEACRFFKNEFENKTGKELDDYMLFYKTTNEIVYEKKKNKIEITDNSESIKEYVTSYLIKLESFFPLNPPSDRKTIFYRFVRELAVEWEISKGYFSKEKPVSFYKSRGNNIEYLFKNFCQHQMKLLRNWTAHNQLSDNLTEKEIAFLFMIAMRSWFNLGIDEVFEYERMLGEIFSKPVDWKETDENFQVRLLRSYYALRYKLEKDLKISPKGNEFYELMKTFGKASEIKKIDLKEEIRKNSKELFYQNFWHGLFPARLNLSSKILEDKPSVRMFINLNFKEISKKSFPYFIGKLIFNESF